MSVGAVNKQTGERIPTAGMPVVDSVLSGSSTNPVQNMVVKAALDEKADTDMVAADFDATASYTAGNYCVQDGKLYKFKNNHSGAWSSADVDEVKITGELSALKSGLTNVSGLLSNIKNLGVYTGDLNDIDETCFCFVGASASHAPVEHTTTHQLLTIVSEPAYNGWMNTRVKIQIYMINSANAKPYIRYFYAGDWYDWTSNN